MAKQKLLHEEKKAIQEKLLAYAKAKSHSNFEYAYAFGVVWTLLTDEQILEVARFSE